jgi:rhodanese-related sulfurtransferase
MGWTSSPGSRSGVTAVPQAAELGGLVGSRTDHNLLEWRLDSASPHRVAEVSTHGQHVVVLCSEGYASSLAAATLRDLGLDATDVDGGFAAREAAGLPTTPAR